MSVTLGAGWVELTSGPASGPRLNDPSPPGPGRRAPMCGFLFVSPKPQRDPRGRLWTRPAVRLPRARGAVADPRVSPAAPRAPGEGGGRGGAGRFPPFSLPSAHPPRLARPVINKSPDRDRRPAGAAEFSWVDGTSSCHRHLTKISKSKTRRQRDDTGRD